MLIENNTAENEIEIRNLNKSYSERRIFNDFSLNIKKGEMVAIVGESGCGKTTLLNIIGLLEPFNSGKLIIDGQSNIRPNSWTAEKVLRTKISYLFQNYALVEEETVKYNLMLALKYKKETKTERSETVKAALSQVGLSGFENKKIYKLSGGEQQRVAIARCMIKPGNIVLADEPTGSVDTNNREIILDLILKMNEQGKTVIIVTHDPYVAKQCSRTIFLDKANTNGK